MEIVPGPDFPTGGFIYGRSGIRNAYEHGRGAILMRGRTSVEEHPKTGRKSIVATEIPYQVNKARLIEKIAELVRDKKIEGISDMRDESDRDGMRIVFELKKDAVPEIVQNNLWKMTQLQESFGINMLAIVDGRPQILSLKQALNHYIAHRRDVVTRRTMFDLRQARDRMHILEGLKIAVDNIDAVIDLIRSSKDTEAAKTGLMSSFDLSARQAQAILDMRLAKLTGLERDALIAEIKEVGELIAFLEAILESDTKLMAVVITELEEVKKEYGDERRTEMSDDDVGDIDVEDMIAPEEMVVTVTHGGYVKRNPKTLYRAQRRGGRGITGAVDSRGGLRRPAVRRVDARHAADDHEQGPRLLQEGVGGAAGGADREGQGVRQPDPAAGGRARRRAAAGARVLRGGVRRDGDAPRPDQEDVAGRVRQHPRLRHHRADDRGRRRPGRACASPRGHRTCCSAPATAGRSASARRTSGRWGASARGVRGIRLRKRNSDPPTRTRWSAWRSSRARSRRRC